MDRHLQLTKQQFHLLLERANKRFAKLRELQTRGDYSWSAASTLFHKTFESFSRVWQFQLSNRAALLETGMQRSELGGIANKIGQLYYNYYLRSGDTGALLESYTFYDAVHTRQYFASSAVNAPDPAAAARQMRFYARFVVVCLFLNRKEEAMQLLQELQASVSAYQLQFTSPDAQEWQVIVNEVTALMAADVAMPLPRSPGSLDVPYKPPLRCRPSGPAVTCAPHRPRMREAILVSYRTRQIKVAELPLELFRMAQALEWQDSRLGEAAPPASLGAEVPTAPATTSADGPAAAADAEVQAVGSGTGEAVGSGTGGAGSAEAVPFPGDSGGSTSGTRSASGLASDPGGGGEGHSTAGGGADRGPIGARTAPGPSPGAAAGAGASAGSAAGSGSASGADAGAGAGVGSGAGAGSGGRCRNPPRQLMYRPAAQQLLGSLMALTGPSAQPAVAEEEFVLLYIAADAAPPGLTQRPTLPPTQQQQQVGAEVQQPSGDVARSKAAPTVAAGGEGGDGGGGGGRGGTLATASPLTPHQQWLLAPPGHHHHHQPPPPQQQQQSQRQQQPPQGAAGVGTGIAAAAGGTHDGSAYGGGGGGKSGGAAGLAAGAGAGSSQPPSSSVFSSSSPQGGLPARATDGLLGVEELLSATRRRLLLVVESDMSRELCSLQGREKAYPLLCLLSPTQRIRGALTDTAQYGSLMTMALACPSQALCALCGQADPLPAVLQRLQDELDKIMLYLGQAMAGQLLGAGAGEGGHVAAAGDVKEPPSDGGGVTAEAAGGGDGVGQVASSAAWRPVFEDALARRLLLHFAFFRCCMAMHDMTKGGSLEHLMPTCFPPLPPAADASNAALRLGVRRAAELLGRASVFSMAP